MLDPIPTSLTKQSLKDLVSLITVIVNASLSAGIVPQQLKQALVTPLLKKPGLDSNDMKNFRPVSNLPFISKIVGKVLVISVVVFLLFFITCAVVAYMIFSLCRAGRDLVYTRGSHLINISLLLLLLLLLFTTKGRSSHFDVLP